LIHNNSYIIGLYRFIHLGHAFVELVKAALQKVKAGKLVFVHKLLNMPISAQDFDKLMALVLSL